MAFLGNEGEDGRVRNEMSPNPIFVKRSSDRDEHFGNTVRERERDR